MTELDELVRLVPPPDDVVPWTDWRDLEERLGTELPDDYKALVGRYGPGSFDNFLHVLQPVCDFGPILIEPSATRSAEILEQLRAGGEEMPYAPDALLPAAKTDNGDTVYWLRESSAARPQDWTITANAARGTDWPTFGGGLVAFLLDTLSKRSHMPIFPRNFPSEKPEFVLYPPKGARRR